MKALATRAAKYGASLGGNTPAPKMGPARPNAKPGQTGFKASSPSEVIADVHARKREAAAFKAKKETVSNQTKDSGQNIMDKNKIKGAKGPNDKKDVKLPFEQVDTYDIVLDHFLNEGYEKEDIIKAMSTVNLTEEPITATIAAIGGVLAKGAALAAKGAAVAGKVGMAAGKAGMAAGKAGLGAAKGAMKGVVSAAKPVTQGITKSATAVKDLAGKGVSSAKDIASKGVSSAKDMASNVGQQVKKVTSQPTGGSGEDRLKRIKDFAKREIGQEAKRRIVQGAGQPSGTNKTGFASAQKSDIAASADLFDIVKGQLLDEGLSEEEIRDIMLTLTPDEIMKEMNQGPSTPVKNYGDSPDKPKILPNLGATRAKPRTTDRGTLIKGGKDTGKTPAQMSQEEYKNFDPKKPDPKQMAAQAKQEKNRQKFNDPMGVKNKNIGGQGLDPMDK